MNENVADIPRIKPLKQFYWNRFGSGPDEAMLRKMDPTKGAGENKATPNRSDDRKKRQKARGKASNE